MNLLNIVAHELRSPIQPILGLSEVIRSRKVGKPGRQCIHDDDSSSIIIRNAKRLSSFSADILDISKIETHSLILNQEKFNLNEILTNVISDYQNQIEKDTKNQNEIKIFYSNFGEDIFVEADKGRITQVISNLMSNAIKFTKVGTITVAAEKENGQDRQQVIISVKDTGIGIDPEILPSFYKVCY